MARPKKITQTVLQIPRSQLQPEPGQPRQTFDQGELDRLAASMRVDGVRQPLHVVQHGDGYRIRNGERRWRAAALADIETLPCIVVDSGDYVSERIAQGQDNSGRPLTDLEIAQLFYNTYLAANVQALAAEQGQADPTTALVGAGQTPAQEQEALEAMLVELTGDTVAAYVSGGQIRVSQQEIATRLELEMTPAARKKLLKPIKHLPPAIKDALLGTASARSATTLSEMDADQQQATVAAAQQRAETNGGDLGAALTEELAEQRHAAAPPAAPAAAPDIGAADIAEAFGDGDAAPAFTSIAPDPSDTFEPDPSLALLTKGNTAAKQRVDGPEPGRGSAPPAGMNEWSDDALLQLEGSLEALLGVLSDQTGRQIGGAQRQALRALWVELLERGAAAGLEAA